MDGQDILTLVTGTITFFALIATVTPTKKDDAIANFLVKVVHVLALNVGKAENKDE